MPSLRYKHLNRDTICLEYDSLESHIDSKHPEQGPATADLVVSWFKKTQDAILPKSNSGLFLIGTQSSSTPFELNIDERVGADSVTKAHWKSNTACRLATCAKTLGITTGKQNCRKCGYQFCDEHTRYQIKLNSNALPDTEGFWCRCCSTCFSMRDGYNTHVGIDRNLSRDFVVLRAKSRDRMVLEISKLEKRLSKITFILEEERKTASFGFTFANNNQIQWWKESTENECSKCQYSSLNQNYVYII